jgi:hypothetical protein
VGPDGTPAAEPTFEAGTADQLAVILAAGRWRVQASDDQGRRAEADVDLAAGEDRALALPLQ